MKPYKLTKIDANEKELVIDLKKDVVCSTYAFPLENKASVSGYVGGTDLQRLPNKEFKYVFCELGNIYCKLDDDYLYKYQGNNLIKISTSKITGKPIVRGIKSKGQVELLVITEDESFLIYKNEYEDYCEKSLDIPFVDACEVILDRLFYAIGNVLYYGKELLSVGFENCDLPFGQVILGDDCGSILNIFYKNKKIYLVCEKKIYKLEIDDDCEVVSISEVETLSLSINKLSIVKLPNFVVFISDNVLYTFDGTILKRIDSYFDKTTVNILSQAGSKDNVYFLPVRCEFISSNCFYVYDFNLKTQGYIDRYENVSEKNGFFVRGKGNNLGTYFSLKNIGSTKNIMCALNGNLGYNGNKFLKEISFNSLYNGYLEISGDFGKETYNYVAGFNKIYLGLNSSLFVIKISCNSVRYEISDVKIKYNAIGEQI